MKRRLFSFGFIFAMVLLMFQTMAIAQDKLEENVEESIANYYYEDFTVTADEEGNVTLEGEVNTLYDKYRIFQIVSKVAGVRTITNNIIVDTELLPDEVIETNIRQEMQLVSSILEPDRITVEVNDGIVFINGKVSFYREKIMMRTIASWQEGVKGIVNRLEVLPFKEAVSDENLKTVLNQIMEYEFSAEKEVEFTVNNGNVTLTGTANSLWAKRNIEEKFSDVLGIKDVDNKLDVKSLP